MVIDAKYKPRYKNDSLDKEQHQDIRQVSGYARLEYVYNQLGKPDNEIIDCLIIYPEGELKKGDNYNLELIKSEKNSIKGYVGMYKYGVKLPVL
jgi:5-methylcytosine-specific restriction enzyme subunit McrC